MQAELPFHPNSQNRRRGTRHEGCLTAILGRENCTWPAVGQNSTEEPPARSVVADPLIAATDPGAHLAGHNPPFLQDATNPRESMGLWEPLWTRISCCITGAGLAASRVTSCSSQAARQSHFIHHHAVQGPPRGLARLCSGATERHSQIAEQKTPPWQNPGRCRAGQDLWGGARKA